MSDAIAITTAVRPVSGEPHVPGSKSITNRALVLAALAGGRSVLERALFAEDTLLMAEALRQLGLDVRAEPEARRFVVEGCDGMLPASEATLYVGNAGTVARFLTAVTALGHGSYALDGSPRMRQRPMAPLADSLKTLGAQVTYTAEEGHLPIAIRATGIPGGDVTIDTSESSQFLSALLLVAPHARSDAYIRAEGTLVSRSYVEMTIRMMRSWGIQVEYDGREQPATVLVPAPQRWPGRHYAVEPDASAASYFMAAAALTGGEVRLGGLGTGSLQGDVRFADILGDMGARIEISRDALTVRGTGQLRGVDVDMNDISDTVMTLAAIAPFAESPTRIRNVAHIRYKECDRISALVTELRRLGAGVAEHEDGLTVYPSQLHGGVVRTSDDHRMAMGLSLIGLRVPGIRIENPRCVNKTFPGYFAELKRLSGGT